MSAELQEHSCWQSFRSTAAQLPAYRWLGPRVEQPKSEPMPYDPAFSWVVTRPQREHVAVISRPAHTACAADRLDCGPRVLEARKLLGWTWGVLVMTSTLAFSLIAALLMGGVIADSFLRKRVRR